MPRPKEQPEAARILTSSRNLALPTGLVSGGHTMGRTGKYRHRTWLRGHLPYLLANRIPKGDDCGNHEWYRRDDLWADCYHCDSGHRRLERGEKVGTSPAPSANPLPDAVGGPPVRHGEQVHPV